jgi:hypothetical protein
MASNFANTKGKAMRNKISTPEYTTTHRLINEHEPSNYLKFVEINRFPKWNPAMKYFYQEPTGTPAPDCMPKPSPTEAR